MVIDQYNGYVAVDTLHVNGRLTLTDTHSPAFWRVNGPLSSMKEFQQAFGCKDGDPMVRAEDRRAETW